MLAQIIWLLCWPVLILVAGVLVRMAVRKFEKSIHPSGD